MQHRVIETSFVVLRSTSCKKLVATTEPSEPPSRTP